MSPNGGTTEPFESIDEFDIQTTDGAALTNIIRDFKLIGVANDQRGNRGTGSLPSEIIAEGSVGDMFVEDDTIGFNRRKAIVQFTEFVNGKELFAPRAQEILNLWILANHEDRIPSYHHPSLVVGTIQRNENNREQLPYCSTEKKMKL